MAVKNTGKSLKNGNSEKKSLKEPSRSAAPNSKKDDDVTTNAAAAVKRIEIPLPNKTIIDNAEIVAPVECVETAPLKKTKSKAKPNPVRQEFVVDMRRKLLRDIFERCLLKRMKQDMEPWED